MLLSTNASRMGRTAAEGNRSWAHGDRGHADRTSGHRTDRRGGAGAPDCQGREDRDRAKERWLFGFGSCLRTDGRAGLYRGSAERGQSPFGGGTRSGASGRYRSADARPTARRPAPGAARDRPDLHARGAGSSCFTATTTSSLLEDADRRGRARRGPAPGVRDRRPARPAGRAPRARGGAARRDERRGQLLPQRRLRGVLPGRHPRPGLRPRVRPGRRRVRARPGDRPRARDQPRGPRLPRGPRAVRRGRQRRRDPAARVRTSGSSATATSAGPCTGCCARSTPRSGPSTRGSRPRRCARPGWCRRRSRRSWTRAASCSCSRRSPPRASACSGAARARPAARRRAARAGQPGRRVRLRRGARAGRGRPVPGRDRRLAAGADAGGRPGAGARRPGAVAAPRGRHPARRSSRSARWSSTTSTRSGVACRRSGCSRPRASSWAGIAAGPSG